MMTSSVSSGTSAGSSSSADAFYSVKAMYLGSEPMRELLEDENGSDVIQTPLKRTVLRTNGTGQPCQLSVTNDSLLVKFLDPSVLDNKASVESSSNSGSGSGSGSSGTNNTPPIRLPIDMLAYCGALRQLPYECITTREFETLDKSPRTKTDPPLFVTIFRNVDMDNTLYCYSFVVHKDEEAMELVKLVMDIYYELVRLEEEQFQQQQEHLLQLEQQQQQQQSSAASSKAPTPFEASGGHETQQQQQQKQQSDVNTGKVCLHFFFSKINAQSVRKV